MVLVMAVRVLLHGDNDRVKLLIHADLSVNIFIPSTAGQRAV